MKNKYVRIGTQYYKVVERPSVFGIPTLIRIPWNIDTLKRDHAIEFIRKIPRYNGEICVPDHLNLQINYHGFYNIYYPLSHRPSEGSFPKTMQFLQHIFGNQLEFGLDYLQILYSKPMQILPILCLVSKERITGKSTFLKWMKLIFQRNATYLNKDSFGSNFNADWVNRLLIMLDEINFNRDEIERIKNLSTSNESKLESKGVDRFDTEFFGKFILCANDETGFVKIDPEEVRFWVLKIPKLNDENIKMLEELELEIPHFLNFLSSRETITKNETRMWFTPQQIETKALLRLKLANTPRLTQDIAMAILDALDFLDQDSIKLVPGDVLNLLGSTRKSISTNDVRKILRETWSLSAVTNSFPYTRPVLFNGNSFVMQESKGRFYVIDRKFLEANFDDLMTDVEKSQ